VNTVFNVMFRIIFEHSEKSVLNIEQLVRKDVRYQQSRFEVLNTESVQIIELIECKTMFNTCREAFEFSEHIVEQISEPKSRYFCGI
jgi:hypothetical protein